MAAVLKNDGFAETIPVPPINGMRHPVVPVKRISRERMCCDGLCVQGRECPARRQSIDQPLGLAEKLLIGFAWCVGCVGFASFCGLIGALIAGMTS